MACYFRLSTFVRLLHRYYASIRLPGNVHVGRSATGLPRPDLTWIFNRSFPGSPGFREKSVRTCTGSLTPRVPSTTRDNAVERLAFPFKSQGRQPERVISELNGWPVRPLSTLRRCLTVSRRMTRGQSGSLHLTLWGSFIPYSFPALTGAFDLTLSFHLTAYTGQIAS